MVSFCFSQTHAGGGHWISTRERKVSSIISRHWPTPLIGCRRRRRVSWSSGRKGTTRGTACWSPLKARGWRWSTWGFRITWTKCSRPAGSRASRSWRSLKGGSVRCRYSYRTRNAPRPSRASRFAPPTLSTASTFASTTPLWNTLVLYFSLPLSCFKRSFFPLFFDHFAALKLDDKNVIFFGLKC